MKKFRLVLALVMASMLVSCSLEEDTPFNKLNSPDNTISTKSGLVGSNSMMMLLGQKLPNPYSISNMQAAHDSLYPNLNIQLPVTHLYVRFLPQDTAQMRRLLEDSLELFDFPLDYQILRTGYYYKDPSLGSEAPYTWQYTTVSPFYQFPAGIRHEVLGECYIPDDEPPFLRTGSDYSPIDLERKAFELVGLDSMWIEPNNARAKAQPQGRFTVTNTETGREDGIKGAKVRVHNIVKWATTYTSSSGYYKIPKNYRTNVHYAIIFENEKDFSISDYAIDLFKANHRMGFHSNSGYSKNISSSSSDWMYAVINNAAYEYYEFCRLNSIMPPPKNLKIWEGDDFTFKSAPMINRLNSVPAVIDKFISTCEAGMLDLIFPYLATYLPDIIFGAKYLSDTRDIYSSVFHELSHASHYVQVGNSYWTRYITYICETFLEQGDCYGNGSLEDAGVCEVGEMWGYFNEDAMTYNFFDGGISDTTGIYRSVNGWIHPKILLNLYYNEILTQKEIFDAMTADVDTRAKLQNKMKLQNPDMANHIDISFAENDFYNFRGEWFIKNMTNETIRISLDREKRAIPKRPNTRDFIVPEGPVFQAKLSDSHPLDPGKMLRIGTLAYSSVSSIDFSDFFETEEVAPESLYIADRDSLIFLSPYLSISAEGFFDADNWQLDSGSDVKSKKWVYSVTNEMIN